MKKVEENKLLKKNALLQSSFDLFLNNGFSKTTISDISKHAGLAKGTFYLYFKDKYDLRDKLIAHKATQLFEDAHQEMISRPRPDTFEDALLAVCDYFIGRFEENPKLLNFLSKNLSWGIFKHVLEKDISDMDMPIYKYYAEQMASYDFHCKEPELMMFTVFELIGSSTHSCILYEQPCKMQDYLPYLHMSIRAIMGAYQN